MTPGPEAPSIKELPTAPMAESEGFPPEDDFLDQNPFLVIPIFDEGKQLILKVSPTLPTTSHQNSHGTVKNFVVCFLDK